VKKTLIWIALVLVISVGAAVAFRFFSANVANGPNGAMHSIVRQFLFHADDSIKEWDEKALSRYKTVYSITEHKGKKCVSDIRELVKANQPNVSQHLSLLRLNSIVDWHQEGKRKCYFLKNPQLVKDILKVLRKQK